MYAVRTVAARLAPEWGPFMSKQATHILTSGLSKTKEPSSLGELVQKCLAKVSDDKLANFLANRNKPYTGVWQDLKPSPAFTRQDAAMSAGEIAAYKKALEEKSQLSAITPALQRRVHSMEIAQKIQSPGEAKACIENLTASHTKKEPQK